MAYPNPIPPSAMSNPLARRLLSIVPLLVLFLAIPEYAQGKGYKRAAGTSGVIMNKLFPKESTTEIDLNAGVVLNQSYVESGIVQAALVHFPSETWGIGIEGFMAFNQDKPERACLETFINDPLDEIPAPCNQDEDPSVFENTDRANYGPAYVPIREIEWAAALVALWNPVYAKQLLFLSATTYFDFFLLMGGGLVSSLYYPQHTKLRNGKDARGVFSPEDTDSIGVDPDEEDEYGVLYGVAGRPDPTSSLTPMITFGIGQKYHFAKRFNFKLELRNYTLVNTEQGFEFFFVVTGGLGVRL